MSIPPTELKRLFARSGNRCAFTDCHRLLIVDAGPGQSPVTLGDVAHIVAASAAGPRGDASIAPADRNLYENLILLCNIHHQLIDAQPATFTPARLRGIKEAHERWVQQRLAAGVQDDSPIPLHRDDRLYSTLLPVARMPIYVHSARSRFKTEPEVQARLGPLRGREMAPFILREEKVLAFQDLGTTGNPFGEVIVGKPERHRIVDWLDDPDTFRWLVELLNRSLNKLTGRRGLHLDKDHHRYYFPMTEPGEPQVRDLPAAQREQGDPGSRLAARPEADRRAKEALVPPRRGPEVHQDWRLRLVSECSSRASGHQGRRQAARAARHRPTRNPEEVASVQLRPSDRGAILARLSQRQQDADRVSVWSQHPAHRGAH